jgi:hypothetical protein
VAVDYRHLGVATIPGSSTWEGSGGVFDGNFLRIDRSAIGVLTLSGERQIHVVVAPGAEARIALELDRMTPNLGDIVVEIGEGARCELYARLYIQTTVRLHKQVLLARGASYSEVTRATVERDVLDHATRVEHTAPDTRSTVVFRVVVAGEAKAVSRGQAVIGAGAIGSRASQRLDALLLASRAEADLLPTMEVATDDVVCNHAATTVKPGEEALFYLQSRGLTDGDAKRLIAEAFLA